MTERMAYILRVRQLAVAIAKRWAGLDEVEKVNGLTAASHDGH